MRGKKNGKRKKQGVGKPVEYLMVKNVQKEPVSRDLNLLAGFFIYGRKNTESYF